MATYTERDPFGTAPAFPLADDEDISLPLVVEKHRWHVETQDRTSPGVAGAIAGFVGGAAALGVVHALATAAVEGPLGAVAGARGVSSEVGLGIAYLTAAVAGAVVGAGFGAVTRYLRKWVPLLVWALVFFTSLAMLILASASAYGRAASPSLSAAILAASGVFGAILSLSLPIRRRH